MAYSLAIFFSKHVAAHSGLQRSFLSHPDRFQAKLFKGEVKNIIDKMFYTPPLAYMWYSDEYCICEM